jgi:hypothetical protein
MSPINATLIQLAITGALLATPTLARADVISIDESVCRSKQLGDACVQEDSRKKSTCQSAQCCRMRYAPPGPQKQRPAPTSVCRDCLKCQPGSPKKLERPTVEPDAAPDLANGDPTQEDVEASLAEDSGAAEAPDLSPAPDAAPDLAAPAPVAAQPEVVAQKTRGGTCATAPWSSDAGTWSLALGALLLIALGARRKS